MLDLYGKCFDHSSSGHVLPALLLRYFFRVLHSEQVERGVRDSFFLSCFFPLSSRFKDALFFFEKIAINEIWILILVQYRIVKTQYRSTASFFP